MHFPCESFPSSLAKDGTSPSSVLCSPAPAAGADVLRISASFHNSKVLLPSFLMMMDFASLFLALATC